MGTRFKRGRHTMFSLISKLFSKFTLFTRLAVPEGGNIGTLTKNQDTDVFLGGFSPAENEKINSKGTLKGEVAAITSRKHGPYHASRKNTYCSKLFKSGCY